MGREEWPLDRGEQEFKQRGWDDLTVLVGTTTETDNPGERYESWFWVWDRNTGLKGVPYFHDDLQSSGDTYQRGRDSNTGVFKTNGVVGSLSTKYKIDRED